MKILLECKDNLFKMPVKKIYEVIDKYDTTKLVNGFELDMQSLKKNDMDFSAEMANEASKRKQELQFRGISLEESILKHYDFLNFYDSIAKILDEKVTVIFTPLYTENKADATYKTNVILKRLLKNIRDNNYNVNILVGNNENAENDNKLTPFDMTNIINIINEVGFAYNIGVSQINENEDYSLDKDLEKRLDNISISNISTINSLRYNNIDFDKLFYYLNEIKYDKNIVLDMNFKNLKGDNIEEKIIAYILEVEKINSIIKNYEI